MGHNSLTLITLALIIITLTLTRTLILTKHHEAESLGATANPNPTAITFLTLLPSPFAGLTFIPVAPTQVSDKRLGGFHSGEEKAGTGKMAAKR